MMHKFFILLFLLSISPIIGTGQQSFTVEQAIDYALKNSNSIKLKLIEISDAEQNIKELRSIGLPKLSGSLGYQYYPAIPVTPLEDFISPIVIGVLNNTVSANDPIPLPEPTFFEFSFSQKNNVSASLDASGLIFDGSYLAAMKAAKLYRSFVNDGMAVTEQEIKNNVTKAYLNVLILDKNKETIDNNIISLEKSLYETKAMYKEGFIEKLDVDRIELSLSNLQLELQKLDQVEQLSKNLLKFQMDYPLEEDIVLSEDLDLVIDRSMLDEVVLDEDIDYNLRAEHKQIIKGLALQDINVDRLKKTNLPTVSGFANVGENLQRNDLFDSNQTGWLFQSVVGLNVNVPIYDGGLRKAQIARAKLDSEKANIDLNNFERAVQLQVQNARIQFLNAKTSLTSTERSLALSQNIYDTTQIKFKEGVGSSIEVIQAESSLFQSQANYINALYDLISAKTDLDIALGTLN